MNKDILQGKWNQIKGSLKNEWADLTDKDLDRIKGKKDQLIGVLQEKYGYTVDAAEEKIKKFLDKASKELNIDTDHIVEAGVECLQDVEGKMKNNILTTVMLAFCGGFLLSWLCGSRSSK